MIRSLALAVALTSVLASTTFAATFPGDAAYVPWRCRGEVMFDALGDQPPALAERDLVGDRDAAAGLRAADADFLYLRIRVDQDPAPGGALRPYAWGVEFDLDGNRATYELLITVDGIGSPDGAVSVFTNGTTTLANSLADPADGPAAATFAFADAARTVATRTMIGGNTDSFVDIAVPWTTLIPLGLDRDTPVYVWVGSSSVIDALDGDIVCHDGRTGGARLDAVVSDRTTGDPTRDPGNGGGGGGAGIPRLEGGGGCQTGGPVGLGLGLG
ncbi:MAG: hypothetical protein H7138_17995, partial [Myxococcales bacterium]|nr:hypothetical protein [Myxococcales bacterium]